jgi:hypothetical protein
MLERFLPTPQQLTNLPLETRKSIRNTFGHENDFLQFLSKKAVRRPGLLVQHERTKLKICYGGVSPDFQAVKPTLLKLYSGLGRR